MPNYSRTERRKLFNPNKEIVIATNDRLPEYDGSLLQYVRPAHEKVSLTSDDVSGSISWNSGHTKVTITHGLNCIPIVTVLDEDNELVFPAITILTASSFAIDFDAEMSIPSSSPFTVVITYGGYYNDGSNNSGGSYGDIRKFIEFTSSDIQENTLVFDGARTVCSVERYDQAGRGICLDRGDVQTTTNVVCTYDYSLSKTTLSFGTELDLSFGVRVRFDESIYGSHNIIDIPVVKKTGTLATSYTPSIEDGNYHYLTLADNHSTYPVIQTPEIPNFSQTMVIEILDTRTSSNCGITVKNQTFNHISGRNWFVTFWNGGDGICATIDQIYR